MLVALYYEHKSDRTQLSAVGTDAAVQPSFQLSSGFPVDLPARRQHASTVEIDNASFAHSLVAEVDIGFSAPAGFQQKTGSS